MNYIAALLMVLAAFLASLSQIVLKTAAIKQHKSGIYELLNPRVIIAYLMLMTSMGINILAYTKINYKLGPIIGSSAYVFVLILSRIFFKEKLTRNKLIGTVLIIAGITIFALFS